MRERHADVTLIELSVVLVAKRNDPGIINPDFLRHNDIVDANLQVKEPPISTPVFSQAVFENGLRVAAEPNRFIFGQQGEPLTEDVCISPEVARRFLEKVPHIPYSAIGINPKGIRSWDDESAGGVADALVGGGDWMSFQDVRPDIHLKALYNYESRQISMDVGRAQNKKSDGPESQVLLFQVNIHRDIPATEESRCVERLLSILSKWKDDLYDFNNLVTKFNPHREIL